MLINYSVASSLLTLSVNNVLPPPKYSNVHLFSTKVEQLDIYMTCTVSGRASNLGNKVHIIVT